MQIFHKHILLLAVIVLTYSCSMSDGKDAYEHLQQGKAKLDIHNYPEAMEALLHAEKLAEEAGNDSVLALSRCEIMNLYDSIYDINEKAHYAIKACDVYHRHKDYDKMYDILSKMAKHYTPEEQAYKYADEIKHYASILLENDTTRAYFYADTLERRSERLYLMLHSIGSVDGTFWHSIEGTKGLSLGNLIEKIKNNDESWRDEIDNDSADIRPEYAHIIATTLWKEGLEDKANDFITYYRWNYADKIINRSIDPVTGEYISYVSIRLNDKRKPEFRATFQNDVEAAVTRFHYEEVLMREQTIRYQRIIIAAIATMTFAIIIAIVVYIRMARLRRRQREEQDMLSASELHTALRDLEEQHLNTLQHLCDTYYENYSNESAKTKTARDTIKAIHEMAASENFVTRLEKHLDSIGDGIMSDLRNELPDLKESDRLLFLYNALGLSIPTVCLLLGERREVIYNRRIRLRAKIQESAAHHKDTFINYLH